MRFKKEKKVSQFGGTTVIIIGGISKESWTPFISHFIVGPEFRWYFSGARVFLSASWVDVSGHVERQPHQLLRCKVAKVQGEVTEPWET